MIGAKREKKADLEYPAKWYFAWKEVINIIRDKWQAFAVHLYWPAIGHFFYFYVTWDKYLFINE